MDRKERFDSRVARGAADECWVWTGSITSNGYGQLSWGGLAHRYAYEMANGPIPVGLHIDHLCHDSSACRLIKQCPHRRCVNPAHLAAVPREQNNRRAGWYDNNSRNGWGLRETCSNGHRYDEGNNLRWAIDSRGNPYRCCRTCDRAKALRHIVSSAMPKSR